MNDIFVEEGHPDAAPKKREMSMMTFMATEGGRKCPNCGRYAKRDELGWCGVRGPGFIMDAYGHLPGFGCNKPEGTEEA